MNILEKIKILIKSKNKKELGSVNIKSCIF